MRVLLIEDDDIFDSVLRKQIAAATSRGSQAAPQIARADDLAAGIAALRREPFDAVLLDLRLPDSTGLETLTRLMAENPEIPVIALTSLEDEELAVRALHAGAEDYLLKNELDGRLLLRSLRYAVERCRLRQQVAQAQQREQQERELRLLAEDRAPAPVTAQIFSAAPLRDGAPDTFRELAAEYDRLIGLSVDQRLFRTDRQISERLTALATLLGRLHAGPHDVVDLHRAAVAQRSHGLSTRDARLVSEEGRLLLIGLLARLVSHYRTHSVTGGHKLAPPAREAPA